jgi:hypothetical protein
MPAFNPAPRRVLLGLHAPENVRLSIETAAEFASAIQSELLCLLVQQEDLFNLAGLPFAQAIGYGGAATPLTLEAIQDHFSRFSRVAQQALVEICTRANVPWHVEHPQGEIWRQLLDVVHEGDILVVGLQELRNAPVGLLGAARLLLSKAEAIVLPPASARAEGPVLAVSVARESQRSLSLAKELSQAVGRKFEVIGLTDYQHAKLRASVIVTPLEAIETMGESEFRRRAKSLLATTVLVAS